MPRKSTKKPPLPAATMKNARKLLPKTTQLLQNAEFEVQIGNKAFLFSAVNPEATSVENKWTLLEETHFGNPIGRPKKDDLLPVSSVKQSRGVVYTDEEIQRIVKNSENSPNGIKLQFEKNEEIDGVQIPVFSRIR